MSLFKRLRAKRGRSSFGAAFVPVLPNLTSVDVCATVVPAYMMDPSGCFAYETGRRVQFSVLGFDYNIYTDTRFDCGIFNAVVTVRDGKLVSFTVVSVIEVPDEQPPATLGGSTLSQPQ